MFFDYVILCLYLLCIGVMLKDEEIIGFKFFFNLCNFFLKKKNLIFILKSYIY